MDHETDKQEPSSKEGGEMKAGDKVWVLCEVAMVYRDRADVYMDVRHDGAVFEAKQSDCRPVEPEAIPDLSAMGVEVVSSLGSQVVKPPIKEPTQAQKLAERTIKAIWAANDSVNGTPVIDSCTKTANDQLRQSLMDHPFGEPSNPPEIPDSSSEPMRDAFEADTAKRYGYERASLPRNEDRYFDSSMEMAWQSFQAGAKYQPSRTDNPKPVKQFVIATDNDGNQTLYVDGVLRDGDNTVYGCDVADAANGCAIKIELRDVDFIVEHWPASLKDLGIEAKQPEPSPLAPSPCMDGVNVDEFVDGVMEARGRTSDPINPSHYKHLPAEAIDIIEAAIAGAPSNQYAFLQGQVIKYILRCWSKKGIEDLRKAKWYLDRLVGEFDDLLAETSGANDGRKEVGE
jgi:hypothetical protein